jgi:hypothetical protein
LAFTPHVKALGLISEFQPIRSTDFDNLKQQNGLDSSCKAALRSRVFFSITLGAVHKVIFTGMMKHLTSMRMNETSKYR